MADEVDTSEELERLHREAAISRATAAAANMPKGVPGECYYCGEESMRLVNRACAPCRDERGLP
jgi:hypothetical protein